MHSLLGVYMRFIKLIVASFMLLTATVTHAAAISVFTYDKNNQPSIVKVEKNAPRLAVIDYAALDIINALGLGDKVVAMPKTTKIYYLDQYYKNPQITNIGTLKEVDYEKLIACKPSVIIIGGRLVNNLETLSKIAPVIYLRTNYQMDYLESLKTNINAIASIYGKEHETQAIIDNFAQQIKALQQQAQGKNAVLSLVTANSFKTLGNEGRISFIANTIGFNNLVAKVNANHGNESSFELLVKLDPDYLFVLDRDSAIAKQGAKLAKDLLNNDLVKATSAYQHQKIIYLNPTVWYLAEGGVQATQLMLDDIKSAFN